MEVNSAKKKKKREEQSVFGEFRVKIFLRDLLDMDSFLWLANLKSAVKIIP